MMFHHGRYSLVVEMFFITTLAEKKKITCSPGLRMFTSLHEFLKTWYSFTTEQKNPIALIDYSITYSLPYFKVSIVHQAHVFGTEYCTSHVPLYQISLISQKQGGLLYNEVYVHITACMLLNMSTLSTKKMMFLFFYKPDSMILIAARRIKVRCWTELKAEVVVF